MLAIQTEAFWGQIFVLRKWLRVSRTQVSETQAKLSLKNKIKYGGEEGEEGEGKAPIIQSEKNEISTVPWISHTYGNQQILTFGKLFETQTKAVFK